MRFLFTLIISVCFTSAPAAWANDWDTLNAAGAFAIMRHALAPGGGDPDEFDLANCSTQRNLDARGRAQAQRIGEAFRERGFSFDVVLTSQWCRCRDTATGLDLGPVEEVSSLNSFFDFRARRETQTRATLEILARAPASKFVVTHQINISALTGRSTRSGEVFVVRHAGDRLEVLGSIYLEP